MSKKGDMHMDYGCYRCSINKYEYCIFLDNCTLACYIEQLMQMSFKKNKLIVDQLFYSGNKQNRFIEFDVKDGFIDYKTARNIIISDSMKKKINSLILSKYDDLCIMSLSNQDYRLLNR